MTTFEKTQLGFGLGLGVSVRVRVRGYIIARAAAVVISI